MLLKLKRFWVSFFVRIWVVWCFLFELINFRLGRDFINVRGLLIQGGEYMQYMKRGRCIRIRCPACLPRRLPMSVLLYYIV